MYLRSLLIALATFLPVCLFAQSGLRPDLKDTANVPKFAEVMPRFQDGNAGWSEFLQANLDSKVITKLSENNKEVRKKGLNERVIAKFVVCEDGGICNISIVNRESVHPELADEVVRVLKLSPVWEPGSQDGKKVKVYYTQPVLFRLK